MPPARKTFRYHVADTARRTRPPQVVNIHDLITADEEYKKHFVVHIDKLTSGKISIKRSGNNLAGKTNNDQGAEVELVTRSFKIPDGQMQELGAKLSASGLDGILSIHSPGMTKRCGRIIPVNIARLKKLKPKNLMRIRFPDWHADLPIKFLPSVPDTQNWETNNEDPVDCNVDMTDESPGANDDQDMAVPGDTPEETQE